MHYYETLARAVDEDRLRRAADRRSPLEDVVRAASEGDGAAWSTLVDRFAGRVRAITNAHRLSAHDAEDVMQTTWLRLFEHVARVRRPGAVGAWIGTTACRESLHTLDAARRQRPTEHARLDTETVDAVDDDMLDAADRAAAVRAALKGLSGREQTLLGLLFGAPTLSYRDIAAALDMPVGSIGPTRQRCIARLRLDPRLRALAD